jgi:hypothetical protein
MNLTDFHAKYYAYELTRRHASDSDEKLAGAIASAQVDLNPHQVDAVLFDAQDQVDKQREELIEQIESKLAQKSDLQPLFTLRWRIKGFVL